MSTATFTITRQALRDALLDAKLFTCDDFALPVLFGARLACDPADGEITLRATNRYVAIERTVGVTATDGTETAVMIPTPAITAILADWKPLPQTQARKLGGDHADPVTIKITDDPESASAMVTVTGHPGSDARNEAKPSFYPAEPGTFFPKLDTILARRPAATPEVFGINLQHLAKLGSLSLAKVAPMTNRMSTDGKMLQVAARHPQHPSDRMRVSLMLTRSDAVMSEREE